MLAEVTLLRFVAHSHNTTATLPLRLPYFFFLSLAPPFSLAVPRNSLARFFLCLPVCESSLASCCCLYPLGVHNARTLLSARLLHLCRLSISDESVAGLELLHGLGRVVDEGEAGALAATVLCPEAEA